MTEKNKKVFARGCYPQAVFIKALSGRRKPVTMGKNQSMFSTQPKRTGITEDDDGEFCCFEEKSD